MIQEEYVTCKTAELLEKCGYLELQGAVAMFKALVKVGEEASYFNDNVWRMLSLPTQSQAMRWLREKHANFISVYPLTNTQFNGEYIAEHIILSDGFPWTYDYYRGKSYEDAAETAIQAVCKYLIKKGGKQ